MMFENDRFVVFREGSIPRWALDETDTTEMVRFSRHASRRVILKFRPRRAFKRRPNILALDVAEDKRLALASGVRPSKSIYALGVILSYAETLKLMATPKWTVEP